MEWVPFHIGPKSILASITQRTGHAEPIHRFLCIQFLAIALQEKIEE